MSRLTLPVAVACYTSPLTHRLISIVALLVLCATAMADAPVGVSGSDTKYPVAIESKINDKDVKLTLTGAAMRKYAYFKVYTLGSYIEEGVTVHTAAELAGKDCAKQLHLVMERGVDGKEMADAFIEGVRLNHAEPKFAQQCEKLLAFMKGKDLKAGDHVWLTHVPQVGFQCSLPGNKEILIENVPFAHAIWGIYLGEKNLGETIKEGLTSRLKDEKK